MGFQVLTQFFVGLSECVSALAKLEPSAHHHNTADNTVSVCVAAVVYDVLSSVKAVSTALSPTSSLRAQVKNLVTAEVGPDVVIVSLFDVKYCVFRCYRT